MKTNEGNARILMCAFRHGVQRAVVYAFLRCVGTLSALWDTYPRYIKGSTPLAGHKRSTTVVLLAVDAP